MKNEWPSALADRIHNEQIQKEHRETYGRFGMLKRDFGSKFKPHPARIWTKRELKNRIAWLKGQRGRLLGKPGNGESLERNKKKLAKYTRELFRRESQRNQDKEREEYNAKRRRKRAMAKRKSLAEKAEAAIVRRRAARKLLNTKR